jgi:tight adherence protein B
MGMIGCVLPMILLESLVAGMIGLLLGGMLPLLWWMYQRSRRLKKMQKHLPGALDLLADGLHSGQTLEQAADMVADQGVSPLKEEFGHAVSLLRLGHSPVAVMERMSRRIPLPEFKVFATAVMVHRQTGGNLARLAARLAASARDRQEFLGHLGAQTVAGRYSAIGLVITVMLGMVVLGVARPQYLEFFYQHELGPTLLITAGVFFVVGVLWMWRILQVRY